MSMAKRSFKNYVEQELGKFPLFVIYAFLEWILIIFLFIDGLLAFIANEFAKFFEMRIPCLLCTRIDHVLVKRDPDFYYNDSICEAHKKEASSLAYCHVHKKLSDIKQMCEGCLLSFATEKESGCDTYKSLVGILHKDLEHFVEDDSQFQFALPAGRPTQVENNSDQTCACCGAPLRMKSSSSNMKKPAKSLSHISQAPAPSPRAQYMSSRGEETPTFTLPHIRYTELKFAPDGEPEIPEDDDVGMGAIVPENPGADDIKAASVPLLTESDDMNETLKTPTFSRGNRFFGIPLSDSANSSPRWSGRILKKSPLEKVEFASDATADGNATNEADSIVSHLKRQVRIDRKSLIALYMELDEERSASAVAANNAMAMITRLQAEKAAVQMEALQYQRMMEEQAEFDEEALQETNNLLAKREEEMKALEAELDAYRKKFGILNEDEFQVCKDEIDEEVYEDHFASDNDYDSNRGSSHKEDHADEAGNRDAIVMEKGTQHQNESLQDHQECNGDVSQLSEACVFQDNQLSGYDMFYC